MTPSSVSGMILCITVYSLLREGISGEALKSKLLSPLFSDIQREKDSFFYILTWEREKG